LDFPAKTVQNEPTIYGYARVSRRRLAGEDAAIDCHSMTHHEARGRAAKPYHGSGDFFGLTEARHLIEAWRQDYNQLRPHSSLGALAPAEYANRQGGGPPEQAQGSAARPLAPPPHLGQNINPGLYS